MSGSQPQLACGIWRRKGRLLSGTSQPAGQPQPARYERCIGGAMRETEVIFDGAHLRAVLHPARSALLMVTFDYRMNDKADFSADAHSTTFARMGHAQLCIKTRSNDWFINPDTAALQSALPAVAARFDRVQMLGFSMGGYGALRFAAALGARSVVAVSPQVSIDPAVVPFETRYIAAGFDKVLGELALHPKPDLAGLLVVDPFAANDLRHARMIQTLFPQLALVRLNFGGHPAFQVVREVDKSWTLHHAAMARNPDPKLILAAHRAGRRGSQGYRDRRNAWGNGRHRCFGVDDTAESP